MMMGYLYIIRYDTLIGRPYTGEIFRHVDTYAAAIRDYFILMDVDCRPHRASLVGDFLLKEGM